MGATLLTFAVLTTLPLLGLLYAELREQRSLVLVCKPIASLIFVVAGALLLPLPDRAAVLLLIGLVLSFVGDVLLIPKGARLPFLLGLSSFLCAHIAYGFAFILHGTSERHVLGAAVALGLVGAPLARWLVPHARGALRAPVIAYIIAITAMVALAVGAYGSGARITLVVGAALFYASDLCVARERFVQKARINGVVGLPLYYAAQLLLVDGLTK